MALISKIGSEAAAAYCKRISATISTSFIRRYSNRSDEECDIAVVGGGIVGAASARELQIRYPTMKIALIEKENKCARHQSGNNSGVIHAGIYYKPGTLKAKLCVKGMQLAYKYLDKKGIKYSKCGKLIVATDRNQVPRLLDLYERGIQNGVKDLKLLDPAEMQEIQPGCKGLNAIWSPHTGIVDWGEVTRSFAEDFTSRGGKLFLNFEVSQFKDADTGEYPVLLIDSHKNVIKAKYVLTCCGLHSDTVAVLTGCPAEPKIIPFRGEYLNLVSSDKAKQLKTNIYPVPEPSLPFLGVHLTPTINGKVIIGPNALLAFSKEGYRWSDINMKELRDVMTYSGFRQLASKYGVFGLKEMVRSLIIPLQMNQVQKYLDGLNSRDVERGLAGVRAQAMAKDGTLIEDFVFDSQPNSGSAVAKRVLHVRNAPSPGATSSMAIAEMIADKMQKVFQF